MTALFQAANTQPVVDPRVSMYPTGFLNNIVPIAAGLAVFMGGLTIYQVKEAYDKGPEARGTVVAFAAFWTLMPPIWFWVEYFLLYRVYGQPHTFDLFKYGQQIAAAIWAAMALFLAALASSDQFKKPSVSVADATAALEKLAADVRTAEASLLAVNAEIQTAKAAAAKARKEAETAGATE